MVKVNIKDFKNMDPLICFMNSFSSLKTFFLCSYRKTFGLHHVQPVGDKNTTGGEVCLPHYDQPPPSPFIFSSSTYVCSHHCSPKSPSDHLCPHQPPRKSRQDVHKQCPHTPDRGLRHQRGTGAVPSKSAQVTHNRIFSCW